MKTVLLYICAICIVSYLGTSAIYAQGKSSTDVIKFFFKEYNYNYHPTRVLNEELKDSNVQNFDDLFQENQSFNFGVALLDSLQSKRVKSFTVKQHKTDKVLGYVGFDEDTYWFNTQGTWLKGIYEHSVTIGNEAVVNYYYNDTLMKREHTVTVRNPIFLEGKKGIEVVNTKRTYVSGLYLNKRNELFNYYLLRRALGYPFFQKHVLWGTRVNKGNRPILRTRLKTNYLDEDFFLINTRSVQEFIMETTDESNRKTIAGKIKNKHQGPRFFYKPHKYQMLSTRQVACWDSRSRNNILPKPVDYTPNYYFSFNNKGLQDTLYFIDEEGKHEAILHIAYEYFL